MGLRLQLLRLLDINGTGLMSNLTFPLVLQTHTYAQALFVCSLHLLLLMYPSDVLHSWTVPASGMKADAVPGRLNMLSNYLDRPGNFYGQCSEICGSNHSFIPIKLRVLP